MGIYDDYVGYTKQYKAEYGELTLVLIEVGSFWEIYDCDRRRGADTKAISELLNIQVSRKNKAVPQVSESNPLMAGFPSHALDRFLQVLIEADYTVVLVSQCSSSSGVVKHERKVTHVLSKGTYVDQLSSADASRSNYVMSVYSAARPQQQQQQQQHYGASIVDLSTGTCSVFEGNVEELHKIVIMYRPCEVVCLLADSNRFLGGGDGAHKAKVYAVAPAEVSKYEKLFYQTEALASVFENPSMLSVIEYLDMEKSPYALVALTGLLDFCRKHNASLLCKMKKPVLAGSGDYLDMFYNTIEQLDVEGLNKLLNKCVTAPGRRYFKWRLLHPYSRRELIAESLQKICAVSKEEATLTRQELAKVYDLERLFRRLQVGSLPLPELENVHKSCMAVPEGRGLAAHIAESVDFELATMRGHAEIDEIASSLAEIRTAVRDLVEELNVAHGVDFFKVEKTERDGYHFSFTAKRWKEIVGSAGKKMKVDMVGKVDKAIDVTEGKASIMSSSVKVTHPRLDDLHDREERLGKLLKGAVQEKYAAFARDLCVKFAADFERIVAIVCERDFVSTCVLNAFNYRYTCPVLSKKEETTSKTKEEAVAAAARAAFVGVRHPIIERINEGESYVENDATVDHNGVLLYGLNASGKSSLLKALGLNIIMAQCGMFVAARGLELTPYDALFCRISKADNLYAGQSTFMVEMSELRKILKQCTSRSLVLADELCAGTESVSAVSIVAAAVCSLANRRTAFVFATHLHELTRIREVSAKVEVFHLDVFFDKTNDVLVYNRKLAKGQGSELYGLEVCKALDMDAEFLETADKVRGGLVKSSRKTKYNPRMLVDKCELCGNGADEVHHIKEQCTADADGFIGAMHKNRRSNLVALCETCHCNVHDKNVLIEGYRKTSKGLKLSLRTTASV